MNALCRNSSLLALIVMACGLSSLVAAPNASDYTQRGLVAHWDAADNVGYGRHDGSSTTWKDLTGNGFDWTLDMCKVSWDGGKLSFNGSGDVSGGNVPGTMSKTCKDFYGRIKTIEIVMMASSINSSIVFSPGFDDRTAGLAILKNLAALTAFGCKGETSLGCPISAGSANIYRFVYDISGDRPSGLASIRKDGADVAVQTYGDYLGQVATPSLGGRLATWTKPFVGNIYALRIYETELLPSEAQINEALDRVRIFGASPSSVTLPEGYSFDADGNLVRPARKAHEAWRLPFDDVKVWYKGSACNAVGTSDSGGADGWSVWSLCRLKSQTKVGIYGGEVTDGGRYYWWGDRIAYRNENVHLPYANVDLGSTPCFVFPATTYKTNSWADVTISGQVVSRPVINYRPAHLQLPTWLPDWPSGLVCSNWTCVLRFRPDSAINPVSGGANVMALFKVGSKYQTGDKPSGVSVGLNTPTALSDRFNIRMFVGDQQINFFDNLIQNGNWVDLGLVVNGPTLTVHMAYEDGGEGAKTNCVYTYSRTFTASESKPTIAADNRTFRLGSVGDSGSSYTFTNGVSASSLQADFHGAFHQVAFWDRTLSMNELKEAMGRPALVSVGIEGNEGNCEFGATKTSVRAERDGEDLNPVLTSANPSATITFECPSMMAGLPQFLRVVVAATSTDGSVVAALNGTELKTLSLAAGRVASVLVDKDLIVGGLNTLTLMRASGDRLVLDAVTLGSGSFQYGVDEYKAGISTFGYDSSNADAFGLNPACGNNRFHCRGVSSGNSYDCFLRIPEDLDGCVRGKFSFLVQNTGGGVKSASVVVNGSSLRSFEVTGGNRYEVTVPSDALTGGENTISLVAGEGGGNWFNMDCLKFVAREHKDSGLSVLAR